MYNVRIRILYKTNDYRDMEYDISELVIDFKKNQKSKINKIGFQSNSQFYCERMILDLFGPKLK